MNLCAQVVSLVAERLNFRILENYEMSIKSETVPLLETKHMLSKIMEKQTSKMSVPVQFFLISLSLREKCPNTEFFLGRIFPAFRRISLHGPEKTPYLDTFTQFISVPNILFSIVCTKKVSLATGPTLL